MLEMFETMVMLLDWLALVTDGILRSLQRAECSRFPSSSFPCPYLSPHTLYKYISHN